MKIKPWASCGKKSISKRGVTTEQGVVDLKMRGDD